MRPGKMPVLRSCSVMSSCAIASAEASPPTATSAAAARHGEGLLVESPFGERGQNFFDRSAAVRADLQTRRSQRHGQRPRDRAADHHVHATLGQRTGALHRPGGRQVHLLPTNRTVRTRLSEEELLGGVQNRRNPALPLRYGDFHQQILFNWRASDDWLAIYP